MPELDQTRDAAQDDEEYLADAYAALDDDRRQKDADSVAETMDVDTSSAPTKTDAEGLTAQPRTATTTAPSEPGTPATDSTAEPPVGSTRRVFLIDNKECATRFLETTFGHHRLNLWGMRS
jgi:heme-binding NEAT domain protein